MAKRLLDRKLKVGAFVSSPAKRARKTAGLFADAMGYNENDIVLVSALYQAPPAVFYEVVESLGEHFNTVALFAHNPGITEFVNDLSTVVQIDNMPTCGIYAVKADCKHWADFSKAKKEFLFFDYPKNI